MTTITPGFAIQQITADKEQKVVSMDWTYANDDGHLGGHHKMHQPYGNVALGNVTSEVALIWLQDQLGNTRDEFDEYLATQQAEAAYEASLTDYSVHPVTSPTKAAEPVVEPAPEPEPEVEPEVEVEPEATTQPAPTKRTRKKKAD